MVGHVATAISGHSNTVLTLASCPDSCSISNSTAVHGLSTSSKPGCGTTIGPRTRYYNLSTLETLRSFFTRCQPEDATLAGFDQSIRAWGRGSEYVHLTPDQYGKLQASPKGDGYHRISRR